jgi:hypothetical protein
MSKFYVTGLLLTALVSPVAVFWLLISRHGLGIFIAAAIAVTVGWLLNLAWAATAKRVALEGPSQVHGNTFAIAARFGWICPSVLVLLTWLVWRFVPGGAA